MAGETEERIDGPTPNGGTYSVAYFRDAEGNRCGKAEAASTEILEYDADDQCVGRTYMERAGEQPDPFAEDDDG